MANKPSKAKTAAKSETGNNSRHADSDNGAATTGTATEMASAPDTAETQPAAWTDQDPRFWQVASLLMVLGIALRQWRLAEFPYHHDEAIHGWFTLGFREYHYDPVYHGPLLYHLLAATFTLFGRGSLLQGANDYTARLVPSLLGIVLLALVLGPARRWLGARGALWSVALLAISPAIVSYQRRIIHDALVMALTLGAMLCFQAARENPSWTPAGRRARVGLVALLTLFVATKANAFFIIAMLASFWVAAKLVDWWSDRSATSSGGTLVSDDGEAFAGGWSAWVPAAIFVTVAFASYAFRVPVTVNPMHAQVLRLVCAASVLALWVWLLFRPRDERHPSSASSFPADAAPRRFDFITPLIAAGVAVFLFSFLFGLWWRIPASLLPGVPEAVQKPTFTWAGSLREITTALPKMLTYWGGQQKAPRLPGPHDYYLVLLTLYELPIVLAALGGIVRAGWQRSPFTDLLLWWACTSFVLYTIANEKVPWLSTHIMLPLALLAGWWLGQLSGELRLKSRVARVSFAVAVALGVIFLMRGVSAVNFERAADHHEPMLYAQSTEKFRDNFFAALYRTANRPGSIWVHSEAQWPSAWYLRDGAPGLNGAPVMWGATPGSPPFRMAVVPVAEWEKQTKFFKGWASAKSDIAMWPRASWPALRPKTFWKWWIRREATVENGVLAEPGEWSNAPMIVATPP